MGWFFILKFHLICNENGELLNFYSANWLTCLASDTVIQQSMGIR